MNLELAKLRKKAKLTQSDLAQSLGITQTQVSKYEINGEIPTRLLAQWARTIGCILEDLVIDDQQGDEQQIFDFDKTLYGPLTENLDMLLGYIDGCQHQEEPYVEKFRELVITLKEKPWVVITGYFDAGKSHLCNFYLGGNSLPTGYGPVTMFPTFVRHISDRPDWFKEDVWLMGTEFDPERWHNQQHCEQHRILAGSWDTLKKHASLHGRKDKSEEGTVLAFVDAPLLHSCVLVDLPGYDDQMKNAEIINELSSRAAIILYLSGTTKFFDIGDLTRLRSFYLQLPDYKQYDDNFPALGNLFIITTHAHHGVSSEQLEDEILKAGSESFYEYFQKKLSPKHPISPEDIRKRFFSFYQEMPERREDLEKNLKLLLGKHMPSVQKKRISEKILEFKQNGIEIYAQIQKKYQEFLHNIEKAKSHYEKLTKGKTKEQRKEIHKQKIESIKQEIDSLREQDIENIRNTFREETDVNTMKNMIKEHYQKKEKAQQQAATHILEKILEETEKFRDNLVDQNGAFIRNLEKDDNGKKNDGRIEELSIPYDKELSPIAAAFMGFNILAGGIMSLTGVPTIVVAAPALLGAVPAIVYAAKDIISTVNWQPRLAKKISDVFKKENLLSKIEENVVSFWDQKLKAVEESANSFYNHREDLITELENTINSKNKRLTGLDNKSKHYEYIKSFFTVIPWQWE